MSRYLSLFCLALLFTACQTVNELPGLADAKKHDGQMLYQTPQTSIVGDVILRTQPSGDYDLIFSKGGAEMLQLQAHGGNMVATGMLARNGWKGPVERTPGILRPWALLKQVVPYFDSNQASAQNSKIWSATFERKGNQLVGAKVQFYRRGSMTFSFAH